MSFADFKNESLFKSRIEEADARATVAYALRHGWIHPASPATTIPRCLEGKKKVPIHWQDFDTRGVCPPSSAPPTVPNVTPP